MTIKEARKVLQEQIDKYGDEYDDEGIEALEVAIKALEQQPSEDEEVIRVSKGTVKARKGRFVIYDAEWLKKHFNTTEAKLYGQPSEDCISRQTVLELAKKGVLISNGNYDSVCKAINELPSVTPKGVTVTDFADKCRECGKQKKGHWIKWHEKKEDGRCITYIPHCKCSECDTEYEPHSIQFIKYCPNCGSRMEVKE